MIWFYAALLLLTAGGTLALCVNRNDRPATWFGVAGGVGGAFCALVGSVTAFFSGGTAWVEDGLLRAPDALAAFFLIPVALLGIFAAIHSIGYLAHHGRGRLGVYWFFFDLTLGAMLLVPLASTPVGFLVFWELMGLFSFALVAYDYHSRATMRAAWIYLLACHAGIAFLIPMFLVLTGLWEVSHPGIVIFLTGLFGFGLKAGLPVLHVWLPEAHPAAPAPVSAVMSGAMINLGLFGILMFAAFDRDLFSVYGYVLLCCGMAGAFGGAASAFAQSNLKRLLACSSVENIGIVCMGLGFGFLGFSAGAETMAFCGFFGAFFHLWNHAVLKGTLFLAAGEVFRSTGILNIDKLGGLMKKIPAAGGFFSVAGLSLSGLPPFNGFIGEFAIYLAAFAGLTSGSVPLFIVSLAAVLILGVTGGVVCGVFAKAIGGVFLGEPRSAEAAGAQGSPRSVVLALAGLTAVAALLLLCAPWLCGGFVPLVDQLVGGTSNAVDFAVEFSGLLSRVVLLSVAALLLFGVLYFLRRMLLRGRNVRRAPTWDCGYAAPSARMEYTGTALAQPLADDFRILSGFRKKFSPVRGFFPESAAASVEAGDPATESLWRPLFSGVSRFSGWFHRFQSGLLHWYILLIVLALLTMLVWGFGCHRVPAVSDEAPPQKEEVGK